MAAGLFVLSLGASADAAENIYTASARQREHDAYISQQSANNTRYFNNADSYPKTDTGNYARFLQQQAQSPTRNNWVPQPVIDEPEQRQQTPAEYFEQTKRKSATGDLDAQISLADCYYQGWGTTPNKAEAFRLYRAVGSAKPHAALMAGTMLYGGDGITANQTEGLALVQSVAATAGKEATDWLAAAHPSPEQVEQAAAAKNYAPLLRYAIDLFYGKNGREHDTAKAIAYLQRGAAAGDQTCAQWLATLYLSPEGFEELKRKSIAGDNDAKLKLADYYYEGGVVALNQTEAYRLYREIGSAKPYAEGQAGYMLFNGLGISANQTEGLAMMKHAAAAGDQSTAEWLAKRFPSADALAQLKRQSAAGDINATLKLADTLYQSVEVAGSKAEAYRFYREAASANPRAEVMADAMLYTGDGVAANETDALEGLKKAAAAGNSGAASWLAAQLPSLESVELSATKKDYAPLLQYAYDVMYGRGGRQKDPAQAVTYYKRLVDAGYDPALLHLGVAYYSGNGATEDLGQAEQWMIKADSAGEKEAARHLAILAEADTTAHPRDLVAMRKWAEKYLAADPTPQAFDLMGRLEYFSDHKEKARAWWLKAVEGGYTDNQHELGFLEWSGTAGPVDEAAGRKHLEAAAAEGEGKSMYELGVAYKGGLHGMPKDVAKAMALWEDAAENGLPVAQNNLAMAYYTGDGVEKDIFKAAIWAEKAAENGYENSQYVIGLLYESGQGVDADPVAAAKWMQKAADQGNGFAMCSLAMDYNRGSGVEKDDVKAASWAQQAAAHGSRNALTMLASFYKYGMGVPKDPAKSVEWMQKAAASGVPSAKEEMAKGYNGE